MCNLNQKWCTLYVQFAPKWCKLWCKFGANGTGICTILVQIWVQMAHEFAPSCKFWCKQGATCTLIAPCWCNFWCKWRLDLRFWGANRYPKPSFEGVALGHFEGVGLDGFEGVGCLKSRGLLARDQRGSFWGCEAPRGDFFPGEVFRLDRCPGKDTFEELRVKFVILHHMLDLLYVGGVFGSGGTPSLTRESSPPELTGYGSSGRSFYAFNKACAGSPFCQRLCCRTISSNSDKPAWPCLQILVLKTSFWDCVWDRRCKTVKRCRWYMFRQLNMAQHFSGMLRIGCRVSVRCFVLELRAFSVQSCHPNKWLQKSGSTATPIA